MVPALLRAFRHRNYRLFFGGQSISLVGTWMQTVAIQWLVYQLTHDTALLGVISLVSQLPAFVVSPLAGVWLDMVDRRRVLVCTQTMAGLQALVLAVLVYTGVIQVWHLVVLSVVLGVVTAFDAPGRQSFLIEIVTDREDLGNAIALNSSQFNMARLIGPFFAGIVIKFTGEKMCFLLNAVSYVAVVVALLLMTVPRKSKKIVERNVFADLSEGFRYTAKSEAIRSLLVLLGAANFSYGMFSILLPAFAKDFFHGDASTLGYLYAASGIGAFAGAIMLALRKTLVGLGTWACFSAGIFSVAVAFLGSYANIWLAFGLLAVAGWGSMVNMAATNTLLQNLVDEHVRGRVMAFYTMSFLGAMPVGAFLGGALAKGLGLEWTCAAAGVICVVATGWFFQRLPLIRLQARPVLTEKGLIAAAGDG